MQKAQSIQFQDKQKTKVDNIVYLIILSIAPLMITLLCGLILLIALQGIKNEIVDIFITYISMIFGLIIVPYLFVKKIYGSNMRELGVKKVTLLEGIILGVAIIGLYILLLLQKPDINYLVGLSIQTLVVAISEEFWARGVLIYIIRQITNNKLIIVMVSSLIFAFITHNNRPFLDNLIYRLPGAIVMGYIYIKTEKLSWSICFHFIYNMLCI